MDELTELLKKGDFRGIFLKPTTNVILQFLRYVFVGGIATVADWGVLFFLTEAFGLHPLFSAIFAFFAGLVVNYFLSRLFVFKANESRYSRAGEFVAYSLIGAVGLGLTEGIMYITIAMAGNHYMIGKVIATVIVLLWNYIARRKIVYK